jgi:hypothetical protein
MTDSIATVDTETSTTKRALLSAVRDLFFTQTNIPAGGGSPVTRWDEGLFDFAVPNTGVITADSAGVNRNASMTALTCYINGRRITISSVTARSYTASKDTYVDVLDNADGTGTLVYTEVANNAASPALAANSMRLGIVVTGATTIATAASINQGQTDRVLPIASSIAYTVSDSLGNLICNRNANPTLIGFRKLTSGTATTSAATSTLMTGTTLIVKIPAGRKYRAELTAPYNTPGAAFSDTAIQLWLGTVGSGTLLNEHRFYPTSGGSTKDALPNVTAHGESTNATDTFNGALQCDNVGSATGNVSPASTKPITLGIYLE